MLAISARELSKGLLAAVISVVCLSQASWAQADPLSQSYSSWKMADKQVLLRYTIASREASRLVAAAADSSGPSRNRESSLPKLLANHLQEHITVAAVDQRCALARAPQQRTASTGYLVIELRFACAGIDELAAAGGQLDVRQQALFALAPSHIHFARFSFANDHQVEYLFTRQMSQRSIPLSAQQNSELAVPLAEGALDTIASYVSLGFRHILAGLDHIAFLLALLLLSTRLRDVLLIVTGFTIGHSLTLSLAVLEIVKPNIAFVESIIGLTIALVAIENIAVLSAHRRAIISCTAAGLLLAALFSLPSSLASNISETAVWQAYTPPASAVFGLAMFAGCYLLLSDTPEAARRYRPAITLLFGLVHGFGFANVLQEVGLPETQVLPALLGFNLGVEFGQIAIVLALWLLLRLASGLFRALYQNSASPAGGILASELLSAGLCCIGVYWFVQRAYF